MTIASLQVNAISIEWSEDSRRKAKPMSSVFNEGAVRCGFPPKPHDPKRS